MNETRFDAWTRRRFGMATGGAAVAGLLGLLGPRDGDARKKKRKKRCKNATRGCTPGAKKKRKRCCKGLTCGETTGLPGNHCCRKTQSVCKTSSECCHPYFCHNGRCCGLPFDPCTVDDECCPGLTCTPENQCE